MPKLKTKRSAAKRFSFTARGKVKYTRAFRRHLLTKKNRNRKRNLRKAGGIESVDMVRMHKMLPNG